MTETVEVVDVGEINVEMAEDSDDLT